MRTVALDSEADEECKKVIFENRIEVTEGVSTWESLHKKVL